MSFELLNSDPFEVGAKTVLSNVSDGLEGIILPQLVRQASISKGLVHVCANPNQLIGISESLGFFAPWLEVVELSGWQPVAFKTCCSQCV